MYQDMVDQFNTGRFTKLKWTRFKALLNCFTPKDACHCTLEMLTTEHDSYMRDAWCQKLEVDIERDGWQKCHDELTKQLLGVFEKLETPKMQQHAYVLSRIASLESAPNSLKRDILLLLLASEFVSVRHYAYQALEEIDASDFTDAIESCWVASQDKFCARLIINKMPKQLQDKHFDSLLATADQQWTTTALYLNVPLTPNRLSQLRKADGIMYAYICAKRGIIISNEEAAILWEHHKKDQRAGLLIWCFGQMKLQDFLASLEFGGAKQDNRPAPILEPEALEV